MTALLVSHIFAATSGVLLGGYQLFRRPRGDARHRLLGRAWVALMAWTSVSSFWIRELNGGAFSWLHVLSVVTIVSLVLGVWRARAGDVRGHMGPMIGSWVGSVIAFAFAVVIPTRHIPTFAVEQPLGAAAFALTIVLTTIGLVWLGARMAPARTRRPARIPVAR